MFEYFNSGPSGTIAIIEINDPLSNEPSGVFASFTLTGTGLEYGPDGNLIGGEIRSVVIDAGRLTFDGDGNTTFTNDPEIADGNPNLVTLRGLSLSPAEFEATATQFADDNDFFLIPDYSASGTNLNSFGQLDTSFTVLAEDNVSFVNLNSTSAPLTVFGDAGDNIITGARYGDNLADEGNTIYGRGGDDLLFGGQTDDFISGGQGDDRIIGFGGNDILSGNAGDDVISKSGSGDSILRGGSGNDTLSGGRGDDRLVGGTGDDDLRGFNGDDRLIGGTGTDSFDGGTGVDTIVLRASSDTATFGVDEDGDAFVTFIELDVSGDVSGEVTETFKNVERIYFIEDQAVIQTDALTEIA
ncbi:calcium-binding protein [Aestuariibius insulae]|uniref:calcium-binding protein n=1 Tax=Aestuariibius insulae TaxID=2058287 RepID=UPI00345E9145